VITVKKFHFVGKGFLIDDAGSAQPVTLPDSAKAGKDASGYGLEVDGAFLAIYVDQGSAWVQLGARKWPADGSHFAIDRRGDKIALVVVRDGQKVDELEYTPGWADLTDAMLLEEADLGEEYWDLGCWIVENIPNPAEVAQFVRAWSTP
jgi:hypothetical protein